MVSLPRIQWKGLLKSWYWGISILELLCVWQGLWCWTCQWTRLVRVLLDEQWLPLIEIFTNRDHRAWWRKSIISWDRRDNRATTDRSRWCWNGIRSLIYRWRSTIGWRIGWIVCSSGINIISRIYQYGILCWLVTMHGWW